MRKLCDDGQLEELAAIEYAVILVAAHGVDTYDEIISDLRCEWEKFCYDVPEVCPADEQGFLEVLSSDVESVCHYFK